MDTRVFVCSYTDPDVLAHTPKGELGKGIYVYRLDGKTGKLVSEETLSLRPNPAFLVAHPTRPLLYGTTECITRGGELFTLALGDRSAATAAAAAAADGDDGDDGDDGASPADLENGALRASAASAAARRRRAHRLLSRRPALGRSTCYINVLPGAAHVAAVNYWDARTAVVPIDADSGQLQQFGDDEESVRVTAQPGASYVDTHSPDRTEHWKYRQRWPHSHCCVTEPYSRRYHFVVDLGLDTIFVYELAPPAADGAPAGFAEVASVALEKGLGPRHLVFHPRLPLAFVINELRSTMATLAYTDPASLGASAAAPLRCSVGADAAERTVLRQTALRSTLPAAYASTPEGRGTVFPDGTWKANSHCSEIRLHPSGKFLYVGNRGHESIAVFRVVGGGEGEEAELPAGAAPAGTLQEVATEDSGGACPRNFNFDASGRFVLVGNQDSNNITVFRLAPDGSFAEKTDVVHQPSPNYLYALPFDRHGGSCSSDSNGSSDALGAMRRPGAGRSVHADFDAAVKGHQLSQKRRHLGVFVLEHCPSLFNVASFAGFSLLVFLVVWVKNNVGHAYDL